MRVLGLLLVLALLVACNSEAPAVTAKPTGQSVSVLTAQSAIVLAQSKDLWRLGTFPEQRGSVGCTIIRGGPSGYAGPIPAVCVTFVDEATSGAWLVTFTETWDARDFGPPVTASGYRWHSWNFLVPANGHDVALISETGDYPPQYGI